MKFSKFLLVFLALLPLSSSAQSIPPLRLYDEGTLRPLRYRLNFIGSSISCVDNSASLRTDCTISIAGGSGTVTSIVMGTGISSTQSPLTTTGTLSIDTSVVVDKTTAQTLTNKTLTAPVLGSSITGTYTLAGTPTIGASVTTTDGTYSIGDSTHRLINIAAKNFIGGALATAVINDAVGTELHYSTNEILVGSNGTNLTQIIPNTGSGNYTNWTSTTITPDTDKTLAVGTTAKRFLSMTALYIDVGGTAGEKPTCDVTLRGSLYSVASAGGASDLLQVCDKSAADAYAWRTVFTAP